MDAARARSLAREILALSEDEIAAILIEGLRAC